MAWRAGAHREEIQKSQAVCIAVSTAYKATYPSYTGPPVNFGSIDQSSKTLAQLAAVINLRPVADYITLLDDDTLLPATWCLEEIDRTWRIAVTTFMEAVLIMALPPYASVARALQCCLTGTPTCSASRTRSALRAGTPKREGA